MNRVLLLLMVWFCACSPENTEIFDLSSSVDDIKLIKLRADHKMLLPDGIAQMEFHVLAYGAQEFTTSKFRWIVYRKDVLKYTMMLDEK